VLEVYFIFVPDIHVCSVSGVHLSSHFRRSGPVGLRHVLDIVVRIFQLWRMSTISWFFISFD